jgi:hypothetical protein
MDFLFNEESAYCVFPEAFCDYHIKLLEGAVDGSSVGATVSPEEVKKAHEIIERAAKQAAATAAEAPPAADSAPGVSMTTNLTIPTVPLATPAVAPHLLTAGPPLLAMSSSNTHASPYQSGCASGL